MSRTGKEAVNCRNSRVGKTSGAVESFVGRGKRHELGKRQDLWKSLWVEENITRWQKRNCGKYQERKKFSRSGKAPRAVGSFTSEEKSWAGKAPGSYGKLYEQRQTSRSVKPLWTVESFTSEENSRAGKATGAMERFMSKSKRHDLWNHYELWKASRARKTHELGKRQELWKALRAEANVTSCETTMNCGKAHELWNASRGGKAPGSVDSFTSRGNVTCWEITRDGGIHQSCGKVTSWEKFRKCGKLHEQSSTGKAPRVVEIVLSWESARICIKLHEQRESHYLKEWF